jgi:hypothetical protein
VIQPVRTLGLLARVRFLGASSCCELDATTGIGLCFRFEVDRDEVDDEERLEGMVTVRISPP